MDGLDLFELQVVGTEEREQDERDLDEECPGGYTFGDFGVGGGCGRKLEEMFGEYGEEAGGSGERGYGGGEKESLPSLSTSPSSS